MIVLFGAIFFYHFSCTWLIVCWIVGYNKESSKEEVNAGDHLLEQLHDKTV